MSQTEKGCSGVIGPESFTEHSLGAVRAFSDDGGVANFSHLVSDLRQAGRRA